MRHELVSTHRADAVLRLHVDTVELFLTRREVSYCGTTGPTYWPGKVLGVVETMTLVIGSCLNVVLQDFERQELYSIRSGLSVVETYVRQTRAVEPMEDRLRNPHRLGDAVEATIGPLADGGIGGAD